MVSPQLSLLIILTMQSYKFYLPFNLLSCEGAKHTNLVQTPLVNNRVISLKQCGDQCTSDKYLLVLKGLYRILVLQKKGRAYY